MYLSKKIGQDISDSLNFKRTKFYVKHLKDFESKLFSIYHSKDICQVEKLYDSVYKQIAMNKEFVELKEICKANISDIKNGGVEFDISLIFNVWDDLVFYFAGIEILEDCSLSNSEYESMLVYNDFPIGEADEDDEYNFIFTYKDGDKLNDEETLILYELIW